MSDPTTEDQRLGWQTRPLPSTVHELIEMLDQAESGMTRNFNAYGLDGILDFAQDAATQAGRRNLVDDLVAALKLQEGT